MICYFIKFFDHERYADSFLAGALYLNSLSYFKRVEDQESGDERLDATEAVAMWLQPHDILMTLNVAGIGSTEITENDLAAPISMSYKHHESLHLLCLYAVHTKGFACVEGKFHGSPAEAEDLQRQLTIDERCFKFGRFAVVIPAIPFLTQLREGLTSQSYRFTGRLVEYYDDTTFHGAIPDRDIPFRKQKRFNYQREWRLCVYPRVQQEELTALVINIGDLSRICVKMESSRLPRRLIELKSEAAPIG